MKESPSFSQARGMEELSGVELSPTHRGLYIALRESERYSKMTDQWLMVEVLKMSNGDVEKFKQAYPSIFGVK